MHANGGCVLAPGKSLLPHLPISPKRHSGNRGFVPVTAARPRLILTDFHLSIRNDNFSKNVGGTIAPAAGMSNPTLEYNGDEDIAAVELLAAIQEGQFDEELRLHEITAGFLDETG